MEDLDFNAQILDCTIRDGGYINNWGFDETLVRDLYRSLSKSGVDIVEIGFRSSSKYFDPDKTGIWRLTPEELVEKIAGGVLGVPIALMVDYGKVDLDDIPPAAESKVSLYRVAAHKNNMLNAIELANGIAAKGYDSAIQLMGIVTYTEEEFQTILPAIKDSGVAYAYFADSYGSLFPSEIQKYIDILKDVGKKIGFHSHNNLQLAFANTLAALHGGIDIVDGTVFGMGRGAGNLPIETLITYFEKNTSLDKFNVLPVLEIIDRYFIDLARENSWGYNLPHMLSGLYKVHPNYSSALVDWREYSIEDIKTALELVQKANPIGFKKDLLSNIVSSGFVGTKQPTDAPVSDFENITIQDLNNFGNVTYQNRHANKDFLILANGPSLKSSQDKVAKFIGTFEPVTIGSNYLGGIFTPDYHTFGNKKRFTEYADSVSPESNLLVSNTFSNEFIAEHTQRAYELIQHTPQLSGVFDIQDGVIMTNCRTIAILSVATAIIMGAERIFIAGMDGYKNINMFDSQDVHFYNEKVETQDLGMLMEKHTWNEQLLQQINAFLTKHGKSELVIITPTTHKSFYRSAESLISHALVA